MPAQFRLAPVWALCAALVTAVALAPSAPAGGADDRDAGPDTIDVSNYPPDMQQRYQLFAKKCSQCHTLARPINHTEFNEDQWAAYVKQISKLDNANMTASDIEEITKFIHFWQAAKEEGGYLPTELGAVGGADAFDPKTVKVRKFVTLRKDDTFPQTVHIGDDAFTVQAPTVEGNAVSIAISGDAGSGTARTSGAGAAAQVAGVTTSEYEKGGYVFAKRVVIYSADAAGGQWNWLKLCEAFSRTPK